MADTIRQIKERINCLDYCLRKNLPIHKSGDRCVSPLRPGATNKSSFVVFEDFWYDHGAAQGGDVIELMKNGFTRKEAVQMCGDYMIQMLIGGQKNGSNKV